MGSAGRLGVWRDHARALAPGGAQRDLWPAGARHGGAVHRVVALGQAHDGSGHGRRVWGADAWRHDQPVRAGYDCGGGRARGGKEARTDVHEPRGAYLEETSGRQGDKRAWFWGAGTSGVTVCVVRLSRGGAVARELVGEGLRGLLVTDRDRAYHGYPVRWRQLGWAHVLRDVEAIRGRGGVSEERGTALLEQAHPMFVWWHRVREGTLQRSTFRSSRSPLRREMDRLVEAGRRGGVPPTEGTCRDILKRRQALWTFV